MIRPPAKSCPVCGRPTAASYAPFCSKRCSDVDLGRWLNEDYAIPVSPIEDDEASSGTGPGEEGGEAGEN